MELTQGKHRQHFLSPATTTKKNFHQSSHISRCTPNQDIRLSKCFNNAIIRKVYYVFIIKQSSTVSLEVKYILVAEMVSNGVKQMVSANGFYVLCRLMMLLGNKVQLQYLDYLLKTLYQGAHPQPRISPTTGHQELTRETILTTEMCWNGGNDECLLHLKKSIQNRDPT